MFTEILIGFLDFPVIRITQHKKDQCSSDNVRSFTSSLMRMQFSLFTEHCHKYTESTQITHVNALAE